MKRRKLAGGIAFCVMLVITGLWLWAIYTWNRPVIEVSSSVIQGDKDLFFLGGDWFSIYGKAILTGWTFLFGKTYESIVLGNLVALGVSAVALWGILTVLFRFVVATIVTLLGMVGVAFLSPMDYKSLLYFQIAVGLVGLFLLAWILKLMIGGIRKKSKASNPDEKHLEEIEYIESIETVSQDENVSQDESVSQIAIVSQTETVSRDEATAEPQETEHSDKPARNPFLVMNVPKKKEKQAIGYRLEEVKMFYDIEVAEDDDYDH